MVSASDGVSVRQYLIRLRSEDEELQDAQAMGGREGDMAKKASGNVSNAGRVEGAAIGAAGQSSSDMELVDDQAGAETSGHRGGKSDMEVDVVNAEGRVSEFGGSSSVAADGMSVEEGESTVSTGSSLSSAVLSDVGSMVLVDVEAEKKPKGKGRFRGRKVADH